MPQSNPKRPPKEFTGRHMLYITLAFFSVIIGVNVLMAVVASRSWTGLVVKNSYVASQNFNAELAAAKSQSARGWTGAIGYKNGGLEFNVHDKSGRPVLLDDVVAHIGRPAYESEDRTLNLAMTSSGTYHVPINFEPGPWQISVRGHNEFGPYRLDTRINVAAGQIQNGSRQQ